MFVLDGSNNRSDSNFSGAFFVLGTDEPRHGALLGRVGIEGSKSITVPLPHYQGDVVAISVKGMRLRRVDAVEIGGIRYVPTSGELQAGEFFFNSREEVIWIRESDSAASCP